MQTVSTGPKKSECMPKDVEIESKSVVLEYVQKM